MRRRQQQLADDDDDAAPAVDTYMYMYHVYVDMIGVDMYSLLHLKCRSISKSNLNLVGLFSAERGKRDLQN